MATSKQASPKDNGQPPSTTPIVSVDKAAKVMNRTSFLGKVNRVEVQMASGQPSATPSLESQSGTDPVAGAAGAGEGEDGGGTGIVLPSAKRDVPDKLPLKFHFEVVSGLGRGDYVGNLAKVDLASVIQGEVMMLPNVEVVVKKRRFIPNTSNPERLEIDVESPKHQDLDAAALGANVVNKIKTSFIRVRKGRKFHYVLQLKGAKGVK